MQSHLLEKLFNWQVTRTVSYCCFKKRRCLIYICLTHALLIPLLYTCLARQGLKQASENCPCSRSTLIPIQLLHFSTLAPVILLEDVKVAAIYIDILREHSLEGMEKADSQDQREHRSFQDKDAINLLKWGGRPESTSASAFSISWQIWSCFRIVKSQRIRFPTADQRLPTLLPLLYTGMPLSGQLVTSF